jgi:hypothetical protein
MNRNNFSNEVRSVLSDNNVLLYEKHNYLIRKFIYPELDDRNIDFVAAVAPSAIQKVGKTIEKGGYSKITSAEGKYINSYYFEKNGHRGLVFSPKEELLCLNRDVANFSLDTKIIFDLKTIGVKNQISQLEDVNYSTFSAVGMALDQMMIKMHGISYLQLMYIKYFNMQKEYVKWYENYKKGIYPTDPNHIEHFSLIYYWDIKIMTEVLGTTNAITIHDAATNLGNFPLMMSRLDEDQLMGLKIKHILATDINTFTPKFFINRVRSREKRMRVPLEVKKLDLLKKLHTAPITDVVIANDILEHFPENISLETIKGLWKRTGKLLLVHVPFEEKPNNAFGHLVSFNADKLRNWAAQLPGGTFLSDSYIQPNNEPITNIGFLIMRKD